MSSCASMSGTCCAMRGGVSREDADRLAHKEYAAFEGRRRADAEASGEKEIADTLKTLEEKAKDLAKRKRRKKE